MGKLSFHSVFVVTDVLNIHLIFIFYNIKFCYDDYHDHHFIIYFLTAIDTDTVCCCFFYIVLAFNVFNENTDHKNKKHFLK